MPEHIRKEGIEQANVDGIGNQKMLDLQQGP